MSKVSLEDMKRRLYKVHGGDYVYISGYKCMSKNANFYHKACKSIISMTPKSLINHGSGCKRCSYKKRSLKTRISTDEFKQKLNTKFPNRFTVLGEYQGTRKKIKVHCNLCGNEWFPTPSNLLNGHGCPKCSHKEGGLKIRTSKEEFKIRFERVNRDKGNHYKLLSNYKSSKDNIKILHLSCGRSYLCKPSNFLGGSGCPYCFGTPKYTDEEFISLCKSKGVHYSLIGEYKGMHYKTTFKCPVCSFEFLSEPSSIIKGEGCPRCANAKRRAGRLKTDSQFKQELEARGILDEFEVLGEYKHSKDKIKVKHLICGHIYYVTPNHLLRGSGCPYCRNSNISRGEIYIGKYLDKLNVPYEYQKTFDDLSDIQLLSYDYYIPNHKILIEYQGEQHYKPINYFGGLSRFAVQIKHDEMKKGYAINHGYRIIYIPYMVDTYNKVCNFLKQYKLD